MPSTYSQTEVNPMTMINIAHAMSLISLAFVTVVFTICSFSGYVSFYLRARMGWRFLTVIFTVILWLSLSVTLTSYLT